MRARSSLLGVGLGVLLLAVLATSAAHAAERLDPQLRYQGTVTLDTSDGYTYEAAATLVVDCGADPCTALVTVTDADYVPALTNDQALPLAHGRASASLPEYGDICTLHWVGAGRVDIAVSPTAATVSRTSAASGERPCGDGSTATASSAVISGTLAYRSGPVCLLDASCPKPERRTDADRPKHGTPPIAVQLEQPSVLDALPTVADATAPANVAWAGAGAVVLVLITAFPSVLFDSATERISAWVEERRARRDRAPRDPSAAPPLTVLGWPLALLGLVAAALASALVDPDFGFTLVGARTTVSIVLSFLVAIALGWVAVSLVMRLAHPRSRPRVEFRPLTLLIVGAAVVFSRVTGFEPGIIFGLIAGVGFGSVLAKGSRGRANLVGLLYLLLVSTAGWIGYSLLSSALTDERTWLQQLALESLAALAITGLSALPIALLPLRGLTGHGIWEWNRRVWAACYLVATAGFLLVLLPLPQSWDHVTLDVWAWVIGYAAYAAAAVVLWLAVVRPWRRDKAVDDDQVPSIH